ncbi:SpoIIE family protein phosphatase [Micromonospora peucetia]|uniref:PAS fold-containing protein n=1 Tax=Micromonospora peucetia TaxID=47871 RepID=A0A1C6W5W9_9ACTN|nr:SpoIIE family protein phosphatase [Micromonospora peucetia]MCX4385519.1 SpoIIE family protein phosphatase [Micromonospora peucetia]WSA32911.1 SpoIIE family protein phosphatase [Micromonospora peucetia]SCL73916.1 PAS fold-containing protein [Micromonospora peucetia]
MPGTVGRVPNPPAPVSGAPSASGTAAVVLRHDWAGTPLGPWRAWDPAVRAATELLLASPVPMTLTLGDDHLLVYNDAYAELIGDRHPDAVGRPAAEVFAESWPLPGVGEAIERTYRSGEPFLEKETTLPLHRRPGLVEQSVFTRGYSPVRDSAGRIVGVLTVAAETTQVTQQLQSLSDFAAALAGTLTLDDVARVALRYAITAFDADRVSFAVDEGGGWRMVRRIRGELVDEADERLPPLWRRIPPEWQGPVATAARSGVPLVVDDGQPLREIAVDRHDQKVRSLATVPLRASVVRGSLTVGYQVPHVWSAARRALLATSAELVGQAAERARRFETQHGTAQLLQRSMLPAHLPDLPRMRIAARYDPGVDGNAAGGDFYDAFLLPDGRLGIVLGDVAGHDVQAAARMGQVRAALRALALTDPRPDAVLAGLDRLVTSLGAEGETHELFVTVVFGVVDADRQRLTLASAGHPAPLIRRCAPDGAPVTEYLDVPAGAPLGLGCRPPTVTVRFAPGDTLLLFSDGVVERRWQDLTTGLDALADAVAGAGSGDPRALCAVATAAVPGATEDDVAVLAVEHALRPSRSTSMEVPAEPTAPSRVRHWMTAQLTEWQVPESIIGAAVLCTSELTTNALLHAGTAARVEIDLSPERLLVSVADSGTRGTVTRAQTDTLSSRGRGLGLIEELSDAWGTDPTLRGSTVWFEILIPPG